MNVVSVLLVNLNLSIMKDMCDGRMEGMKTDHTTTNRKNDGMK